MNILVTGASGFIGQNLIKSLIQTEHNITACIHKTELPYKVKILKIDYAKTLKITDWLPYLIGIDLVVNCVGIISENKKHSFDIMHNKSPVALFKACEKTHVKRIIQISSLGADSKALVNYHKSKKHADDYLRGSPLEWFVLRPSLIYGEGGKSHSFFQSLSNLPFIPLIDEGHQLIQPVSIDVIVRTIQACIQSKHSNQTLDLVGKKAITYKEWMNKLRTKKSNARFIKLPLSLMKTLAKLLSPLKLQLFSHDNLILLEQNNVADYLPIKKFLEKNA